MNLPDFFELPLFNDLKQRMGLTKKDVATVVADIVTLPPLSTNGAEVELKDILRNEKDGTLDYNGERVIAYIRDVGLYEPRYHVADCKKLQQMRRENRFDRYFACSYTDDADQKYKDGFFVVNSVSNGAVESTLKKLKVCRYCLEHLSVDEFSFGWPEDRKKRYVDCFTPEKFFGIYGTNSDIINRPKYSVDSGPINDYPKDFPEISRKLKERIVWKCQGCGKDLSASNLRSFLHTHHLDGVKHNNHPSNLKGLCIACHAKEPAHGHIRAHSDFKEFIKIFPN